MGDPKKPRKQYTSPRNPWQSDHLAQELYLVGTYGLRNKRELWRAQTLLSRIRKQARALLAAPAEERARTERVLISSLQRLGVVGDGATVDDVLGLTVENLLERRLQTVVWKKRLAATPYQARQLVTHRHIQVGGRIITIPSFLVRKGEEATVRYRDDSPYTERPPPAPAPAEAVATVQEAA